MPYFDVVFQSRLYFSLQHIEIYVLLAFKGRILAKRFSQIIIYNTPIRVDNQVKTRDYSLLVKNNITAGFNTYQ